MSERPVRSAARGPTRALQPRPPFSRRVLFEALENRLLLSADPLATLGADGLLRLNLTAGDDAVIVAQAGGVVDGGVILDISRNGIAERFGDSQAGVHAIFGDG